MLACQATFALQISRGDDSKGVLLLLATGLRVDVCGGRGGGTRNPFPSKKKELVKVSKEEHVLLVHSNGPETLLVFVPGNKVQVLECCERVRYFWILGV